MQTTIKHAAVHHLRAPSSRPVVNAFGTIHDRHALFLSLQSETGHTGWGESWINFPAHAPYERALAFQKSYIPYLLHKQIADIPAFSADLFRDFIGPATQANAIGPLLSALCAVECALYDLRAQEQKIPLASLWFKNPASEIQIYASGINPPLPFPDIDFMLELGVTLFKLKLGFGEEDLANLDALLKHLNDRAHVAVDVNRGWTLDEALHWMPLLHERNIRWLEEPLRPDHERHYPKLRDLQTVPISAGENVWIRPGTNGDPLAKFAAHNLQPDITKNCPPSAALELIARAPVHAKRIIPHFLGSAIGQAASLHLAAGCPNPLCEYDLNPNPLRTNLLLPNFQIQNGKIHLPLSPGLGHIPDAFALDSNAAAT